jgi:hypothetical protein
MRPGYASHRLEEDSEAANHNPWSAEHAFDEFDDDCRLIRQTRIGERLAVEIAQTQIWREPAGFQVVPK